MRSVVFVCAPNGSAVRKAKTASPACRRFVSAKRPEGKSCTAHHLIKTLPFIGGVFLFQGHISVINPAAGMKNSGKWGKKLPSVDGYNPAKKAIKEGESLSEQFGKDKEPYMNYYVFTGKKHS